MSSSTRSYRVKTLIAGFSAIALLLAAALPHYHDNTSTSHPVSHCRACRIQEGFVATPSTPLSVIAQPLVVAFCTLRPSGAPRISRLDRRSSPRAPPTLS